MKIQYKQGDLLECTENVIVQGVNCMGIMGGGIAYAIRKTYPKAYDDYKSHEEVKGLTLGDCIWSWNKRSGEDFFIVNAVTQQECGGDPSIVYVSYDAIRSVFKTLNKDLYEAGEEALAFPKIGAGLANGDWSVIEKIIEEECTHVQPVCYVL